MGVHSHMREEEKKKHCKNLLWWILLLPVHKCSVETISSRIWYGNSLYLYLATLYGNGNKNESVFFLSSQPNIYATIPLLKHVC